MKVLVDANIFIDFIEKRANFTEAAEKIIFAASTKIIDGYVAFHTIPTIWYLIRRLDDKSKRWWILYICNSFTVISAPHSEVVKSALDDSFKDFEDRLQVACAKTARADFIITRNIKDYKNSSVKAILPEEFIKINHI